MPRPSPPSVVSIETGGSAPPSPREASPRIVPLRFAILDQAEVDGVAERVLRVRCDVVALFAEHLVELLAAIAAHDLDADAEVMVCEAPEHVEEARIDGVTLQGHAVREQRVEAIL